MDEALWQRVEAVLDARGDPFADARLAAVLAADPEAEERARRLVGRLALLAEGRAPRQRPRWPRALLAAGLIAVLALTLRRRLEPSEEHRFARSPASLHVSLEIEHVRAPEPRFARVVLEGSRVQAWTLEGDAP